MAIIKRRIWDIILVASALFAGICAAVLIFCMVDPCVSQPEPTESPASTEPMQYPIIDSIDALISDALSAAKDAVYGVAKVYWIDEEAIVAPAPDPQCYGETEEPSSLQWLLDAAAEIMRGQEIVFRTDIEIAPYSKVTYYLDESIFVVTWQQVLDDYVYTFSEVKITHPSQFRRYLANNEYQSDYTYPVSKMATTVHAVVASSADYYLGRNHGIIVYEGIVRRTDYCELVDTCFIDKNGDLILVRAGDLVGMEQAQAYVDAHDIDFSLAFGPILIRNGKRCEPKTYYLGEIKDHYPRAALCQKDDLHYILVMANAKGQYCNAPTIKQFTNHIEALGCISAYTLDGGKTATLSMRGQAMNPRSAKERWVSDIIYFATAIPSTEDVQP